MLLRAGHTCARACTGFYSQPLAYTHVFTHVRAPARSPHAYTGVHTYVCVWHACRGTYMRLLMRAYVLRAGRGTSLRVCTCGCVRSTLFVAAPPHRGISPVIMRVVFRRNHRYASEISSSTSGITFLLSLPISAESSSAQCHVRECAVSRCAFSRVTFPVGPRSKVD